MKKNVQPESIANLSKPGMTNNPNGRPAGTGYKTFMQGLIVDMMDKQDSKGTPFVSRYLEAFMSSALEGTWAAKILAERLFQDDMLDQIDAQLNKSRREDTDFLSYRIYRDCHDIQQRILLSKEHFIYCMAGRRAGKSEAGIRKAQEKCIVNHDARVLIIGLSFTRAIEVFWQPICDAFHTMGIEIAEKRRTEGLIKLNNGSEIHFHGNTTVDERDKIRGSKWDLVIIDEVQSQKALPILIEEIIEPTLLDRRGQLMLCGTGPKVRGTYWEMLWTDQERKAARFNWNITDNPFIPDYRDVLERIKVEKGLTDKSPLYQREYLGQISYDDDALVYRLAPGNTFAEADMAAWINSHPVTDIKFTAGLDYGYVDSDAFAIIMFSSSRPERWLVYEHKGNRTGITELADKIKKGIEYVQTSSVFAAIPGRHFYIYSDTGGAGKKISYELSTQYGLPCLDAYKVDKNFAIEQLQEEVRRLEFKTRAGSVFEAESLKTVFARNERDELTRVIDDDTFHPDMLDAILYALRFVWINYSKK